jgi:hypothetical protein
LNVIAKIFRVTDQSKYVSVQVKEISRGSSRHIEAECSKFVNLREHAHPGVMDPVNVLLWRNRLFESLYDRIRGI